MLMKTKKQELKSSDKARKTAEKTGVTVQPSPEPVANTETSAEWYAKATKKLKSTKSMDDNGVAKVKRTAKEHSELWKSKHAPKDDVAKVAKNDDKKVHGGTAWPTEQEEEKGLEGLDAFDFNKAGSSKKKSKSPRGSSKWAHRSASPRATTCGWRATCSIACARTSTCTAPSTPNRSRATGTGRAATPTSPPRRCAKPGVSARSSPPSRG